MSNLDVTTAYLAMFSFLEEYGRLTSSDDIAGLLGSMSLLNDGQPADAGIWSEWEDAVQKAIEGRVDARLTLKGE